MELKKLNNYNIIENDIQYQEGIFEVLEINKNIDFIIINNLLPGEDKIEILIKKILEINEKIKLIIILDVNNYNLKNSLLKLGVYGVCEENNFQKIIQLINKNNYIEKYNEEINKEIEIIKNEINNEEKNNYKKIVSFKELKNNYENYNAKNIYAKNNFDTKNNSENNYNYIYEKNRKNKNNNLEIIAEKNKKIKKQIIINKIKDIYLNIKNTKEKIDFYEKLDLNNYCRNAKCETISVHGNNGSGKSVMCVKMAYELAKKNNKVLIIDFDFLNNSLHTILGVKKYSQKIKNNYFNNGKIELEDLVINVNKNIDLISGINLIFDSKNKITQDELNKIIKKLENNYNKIIIDTSSECFFDYTRELMKIAKECVFVTEPNLLEISKSKRFLEIYENQWKIDNKKIKIIFNKVTKYSIDFNILKKLYSDYEIIGNIRLNNKILDNNIKIQVI